MGIYAPLQKLFALRRGFRPDFFDKLILSKKGHKTLKSLQSWGFCDPRILAGQNRSFRKLLPDSAVSTLRGY